MKKIFVITDAGRDHDDELAFTVLAGLQRRGQCEVVGAIANLQPTLQRAQLVKGSFQTLGLGHVPVAQGDPGEITYRSKPYEFDVPYLASPDSIEPDGQLLMQKVFKEAHMRGEKITLLLISGMMDANQFLLDNENLAKETIDDVVIMGSVETDDNGIILKDGLLLPGDAYNNCVDKHLNDDSAPNQVGPSAYSLYKLLQKKDIPTTVISRYAAYEAHVSTQYYAGLCTTNHPVARRLYEHQRQFFDNFWSDIVQGCVNARFTRDWFVSTYFAVFDDKIAQSYRTDNNQSPWDHIKKCNLYDALAVLAAVIPEGLFEPENLGKFNVIGINKECHGVQNVAAVRRLLSDIPREILLLTKNTNIKKLER